MLSRGVIKGIRKAVANMFDAFKAKALAKPTKGIRIKVTTPSIPQLYHEAAIATGGTPSDKTINTIHSVTSAYLDAQEAACTARVLNDVHAHLADESPDNTTPLEDIVADTLESVKASVQRVVDTQAQASKSIGIVDGITQMAAKAGVDDPTVYWVVVKDRYTCDVCKRLHILPDGITPKVYKLSETTSAYYQKGSDCPCISGPHPRCRCVCASCPSGWGFKAGRLVYIGPGYDCYADQRGL